MEISVVIPTKDRPRDLKECIDSVLNQVILPEEIILVDDGSLTVGFIRECEKGVQEKGILFQYLKKTIAGLSLSRNLGAQKSHSPVVLYLDDDVVLDRNYIEILKREWSRHRDDPRLGGIGGVIKNMRKLSFPEKIFHKLFLLSSPVNWDVTKVGFQVWSTEVKRKQVAYYLPGGITSFRKSLLKKFPFRQLSPGRTPADDVEFFMKAKKAGYYFILEPEAKLFHKITSAARENEFGRGIKEGFNQYRIFRDNVEGRPLKYIRFIWSSTGWILRQFIAGNIVKGAGMIAGYIKGIFDERHLQGIERKKRNEEI